MSHSNLSMQSLAARVNPPSPRRLHPSAVHNDNVRGSAESHRHIRHGIAEGRATPLLIAVYFTAMVFFVCLVLYGLNHQGAEPGQQTAATNAPASSAPAPSAPASAPAAAPAPAPAPAGTQQPNQPASAQPPSAQQSAPAPKQ